MMLLCVVVWKNYADDSMLSIWWRLKEWDQNGIQVKLRITTINASGNEVFSNIPKKKVKIELIIDDARTKGKFNL